MNGGRGDSAGRMGFHRRYPKVYQRRITGGEAAAPRAPHFIATNAELIAQRAPAWILGESWPPPGGRR